MPTPPARTTAHGWRIRACSAAVCLAASTASAAFAQDPMPVSGTETESRFPPLQLPPGFDATLFACDPLVEYPSVIALGPAPGTLFVAHDYMTGLGFDIVRRDEIRLLEDLDGDGYADTSTVFADGFNSVQGLAFSNGEVFVAHAPLLTVLRDVDGDGVADQRRDLLGGFGLPPEDNPQRLHAGNGIAAGHDGWLYLALGDHGCDVPRPEGDRLILHGGGILRCRRDGSDLHVFATGTRNIYDVALDPELHVFIRDNENDGGAYKNFLYHSFFGAGHGYPYLFQERPGEAVPPLFNGGLGASAGGVFYAETQFPEEYRNRVFFCDWAGSVIHFPASRVRSAFKSLREIEFARGDPADTYPFKPTDIIVDWDGSLIVSDWCDGQRPKRGRGRIYRIAHTGSDAATPERETSFVPSQTRTLDESWADLTSESAHARCAAQVALEKAGPAGLDLVCRAMDEGKLNVLGRFHAVWLIATAVEPSQASALLLRIAREDPDPGVRAQAVRALGDLVDPILTQHRLDAAFTGNPLADSIAALAESEQDVRVVLELVIAMGRSRSPNVPSWIRDQAHLSESESDSDPVLAHAAMQALRRSPNRRGVLELLDLDDDAPARALALMALAEQAEESVAQGILTRLGAEGQPHRRIQYADLLTRIHRKPGPWTYWEYRPAPRSPNTETWAMTAEIHEALIALLSDPENEVRGFCLRRMQRENIPVPLDALAAWLAEDCGEANAAAILASLETHPAAETRDLLTEMILDPRHAEKNRLTALHVFGADPMLADLAHRLEDGPVLAETLRLLGAQITFDENVSLSLFLQKLDSTSPPVRAAAIRVLGEHAIESAREHVLPLLGDPDDRVRAAATAAAGNLEVHEAADILASIGATTTNPELQRECLVALRLLREPRGVSLAIRALENPDTLLPAIELLREFGDPAHAVDIVSAATRSPSVDILRAAAFALERWRVRDQESTNPGRENRGAEALRKLQGATGQLLAWQSAGPLPANRAAGLAPRLSRSGSGESEAPSPSLAWQTSLASAANSVVRLLPPETPAAKEESTWLCTTEFDLDDSSSAQFLGSCDGAFELWLNGKKIRARSRAADFALDSERFEAQLDSGTNRVAFLIHHAQPPRFQLHFRLKSSAVEQEELARYVLEGRGNLHRGRELFFDAERTQCILCHQINGQGGRIGPDLTGIGSRFSRVYILESILDPNRNIAPSFQSVLVNVKGPESFFGVKILETGDTLVLGDITGRRHDIPNADIVSMKTSPVSLMPPGLEKRLAPQEFADLMAFLVSEK